MNKVFVYGTLKNSEIRKKLFNNDVQIEKVILKDYKKEPYGMYQVIKPNKGSIVRGNILHVTDEQMRMMDTYESVPYLYMRKQITMNNENIYVYVRPNKS
jgi:gamma-glutamylcyclotransferase (GGCT)/AIG2-like uncharacterized protein YtfP